MNDYCSFCMATVAPSEPATERPDVMFEMKDEGDEIVVVLL